MNPLIYVSKGYIPNLGPLGLLLHVEKFVVGGGGWWWKTKFSVHLSPKLNNNVCAGEWETPHTLLLTVVTLFSHSQKRLYNGPFEKNCLNLYTVHL